MTNLHRKSVTSDAIHTKFVLFDLEPVRSTTNDHFTVLLTAKAMTKLTCQGVCRMSMTCACAMHQRAITL